MERSSLLKEVPIANRAVSAEYLRWFTNVQQIEKDASTREVCENVIKKVTVHTTLTSAGPKVTKLRYVEHALNFPKHAAATPRDGGGSGTINPLCTAAAPPSSPGPVDWFVSHSWDSPWHGLVEAVESHSKTLQEDTDTESQTHASVNTRYWVDILAICQHYGTAHQTEDLPAWGTPQASDSGFAKVLKTACERGGGLLLYYQPLLQPKALKRVWCLYEMHQALQFKFKSAKAGVQTETINIEMSKYDRRDFEEKMRGDNFSEINEGLCAIDARTAEATVMSDWDNIVESILQSRNSNPEKSNHEKKIPEKNRRGFDGINTSIQNEMRRWLAVHTETLLKDVGVTKANEGTEHGFYYRRSHSPSRPSRIDEGPSPSLTPYEKLNLGDPFWETKMEFTHNFIAYPMFALAALFFGTFIEFLLGEQTSSDETDTILLALGLVAGGVVSMFINRLINSCRYGVDCCGNDDEAKLPPNFPSVAARYFYKPNAVPRWLRAQNVSVVYYLGGAFRHCTILVLMEAMIAFYFVFALLHNEDGCRSASYLGLTYKLLAVCLFVLCLHGALRNLQSASHKTNTELYRLASAKLAAVSCRMQAADDTVQREKVKQETRADIIAVMNILRSLKGGLVDVSTKLRLDMCRCIILSGMQLADDAEKMYLKGDPYQHASLYEKCLYFVSPDDEECAHRRFLKRKIFMAMAERTCPIDANSNAILWDDDTLTELKQWPVSWIENLSTEACIPSSMKADYRFKDLLRPDRRVVDSPRSVSRGRQCLVSCWSNPERRCCGLFLAGITLVILFNLLVFGWNLHVIRVKCKTAPKKYTNITANTATNMTMTMPCYENITLSGCLRASTYLGLGNKIWKFTNPDLPSGCYFYEGPRISEVYFVSNPDYVRDAGDDRLKDYAKRVKTEHNAYYRALCKRVSYRQGWCKKETTTHPSSLCTNNNATTAYESTMADVVSYELISGLRCDATYCRREEEVKPSISTLGNLTCP